MIVLSRSSEIRIRHMPGINPRAVATNEAICLFDPIYECQAHLRQLLIFVNSLRVPVDS